MQSHVPEAEIRRLSLSQVESLPLRKPKPHENKKLFEDIEYYSEQSSSRIGIIVRDKVGNNFQCLIFRKNLADEFVPTDFVAEIEDIERVRAVLFTKLLTADC